MGFVEDGLFSPQLARSPISVFFDMAGPYISGSEGRLCRTLVPLVEYVDAPQIFGYSSRHHNILPG
jgi:hypothetical protein